MDISHRTITTTSASEHRYAVLVLKPPALMCDYIIRFSSAHRVVLADWYSPAERCNAWMLDFFDLQALYDLNGRSRFDLYTPMHYSADELETLFIRGIAPNIQHFMSEHDPKIVFWAATRPALARYYNYLLKKYATGLDSLYRSDIQKEVGLYVIESRWRAGTPGETPFLARERPVTPVPAVQT